jgi:predicted DCC family thiol-disulfide oxidoreductase YuxK
VGGRRLPELPSGRISFSISVSSAMLISQQPTQATSAVGKVFQRIRRVYDKQIDGTGLALFRIVFCTVLLAEIGHIFYFRALIFDPIPFIVPAELDVTLPLVLWMGTALLLLLGLYTRPAAVANYGFSLLFFSSARTYTYMMTPVYVGLAFLFLFLPLGQCLSLDRLRRTLRYSTTRFRYNPPRTVSQLAYYVPIVLCLAFVYLDSTLYKLASPLWLKGLGMWLPLSMPFETQLNSSLILNNEFLVKALSYLTLAFEFFFLFLFPFRRYRLGLMVIGVGLHLGILLTFTFPLFAIGFGSLYLLMVPVSFWRRLVARHPGQERLTFYYDANCPLCARTRLVLEFFDTRPAIRFRTVQHDAALEPALQGLAHPTLLADVHSVDRQGRIYRGFDTYLQVLGAIFYLRPLSWLLRVPGVYHLGKAVYRFVARHRTTVPCTEETCGHEPPRLPVRDEERVLLQGFTLRDAKAALVALGLVGLVLLQYLASYNTPLVQLLRRKSGLESTRVGRVLEHVAAAGATRGRTFFGITNHPIALDEHFAGYTRLVAVTYTGPDGVERFLPITRPSGQPGAYLYGVVWLKWTYLVVSHQIKQQNLEDGLRSFTAFWANKNHVDLASCRFRVKVKKIQEATDWQPNLLNQQLAAGWADAGTVDWQNQQFQAHLADINSF